MTTLGDVTTKIGSGSTPTGGEKAYKTSGTALIRSQNVLDMDFSRNGLAFIDDEQAEKMRGVTVEENDVLLNITGDSIARCCIVPSDILPARVNQHVAIIRPKEGFSSRYILYFLQYLKPYLLQICKVGGTRNALTKEALEKLEFWEIPDSNNAIAPLVDIDSLLKNNSDTINATYRMLETIYNYWFNQYSGSESHIETIYNTDIKKEIPSSWKVESIGKIIKEQKKSPVQVNDARNHAGKIPFFTSGEEILSYDNFFVDGFNMFLNTGGNADVKAYLGKAAYSTDTWCINAGKYSYYLFCYFLSIKPFMDQLFFTGSGLKHLQKDALKRTKIVIPDDDIIAKFNRICETNFKMLSNIESETSSLSHLKELLLPMIFDNRD